MSKALHFIFLLSLLASMLVFITSCSNNSMKHDGEKSSVKILWHQTEKEKKTAKKSIRLFKGKIERPEVTVFTSQKAQSIDGFGGAFNEAGWKALSVLTEEERDKVMANLFDPEGESRYNIGRIPIGASDYALERYTHNETAGDYEMKNFSIERDHKHLLPYIRAALTYVPDLPIWASAWTPPTWMKDNLDYNSGKMLDDPKIYQAYALYLKKFVEAYQNEGINLYEVAVQNEPKVLTPYPTCEWDPDQYYTFVKNHLGPLFKKNNVKAGIMLGTFNYGDEFSKYIDPLLSDEEIRSYVTSVGVQWDGVKVVAPTARKYPEMHLVQTETECGNWSWKGKWNREIPGFMYDYFQPQNDWPYAAYTFNRIRDYFKAGVNSYLLWNIVLDEEGYNNNKQQPWPQNAAVVVNKKTKKIIYTPMYYTFLHFSHFVEKGAHYIPSSGKWNNSVAFENPNGDLVIVLKNNVPAEVETSVKISEDKYFIATLAPESFSTFIVPAEYTQITAMK